jgi:hypothetical protein
VEHVIRRAFVTSNLSFVEKVYVPIKAEAKSVHFLFQQVTSPSRFERISTFVVDCWLGE